MLYKDLKCRRAPFNQSPHITPGRILMEMSAPERVIGRFRAFSASFSVFLLLSVCAQTSDVLADDRAERLYAGADLGVFFLDLPEASPFIETNSREEAVGFLEHYDASYRAGPLFGLAVGGEYGAFGSSLFTEVRGFLNFHSTDDVNEYERKSEGWNAVVEAFGIENTDSFNLSPEDEMRLGEAVGNRSDLRLLGWVGAINGDALPHSTPNFAWGDPIRINTQRDVKFWGGDLVTGVSIWREERSRSSLFIGPSYKKLTQEFDIFAYEANREPTVNNMNLDEELNASYYGGIVGIRIDVPFKGRWNFSGDGEFGAYQLDSEYEGFQRDVRSSQDFYSVQLKVSDSSVTSASSFQTSLAVKLENITLQGKTGIEYIAHVPVMRYASLGESFASGDPHDPARIEYSKAFGFSGEVSMAFGL